ncbi:MAG: hypothetical protein IJ787_06235 [Bacilli bacterium]|nr:hypothetical protein [Bacilli bacterium]
MENLNKKTSKVMPLVCASLLWIRTKVTVAAMRIYQTNYMCCVDRFDGLIKASKTRQRLKTISQSDAHGSLALSQFEQAEQQYCGIRPNKSLSAGETSTRTKGYKITIS